MKPAPCPICERPPTPAHAPFCSQGCRDRDLLQWLGEGYRIPAHPGDPDAGDGGNWGDGLDNHASHD